MSFDEVFCFVILFHVFTLFAWTSVPRSERCKIGQTSSHQQNASDKITIPFYWFISHWYIRKWSFGFEINRACVQFIIILGVANFITSAPRRGCRHLNLTTETQTADWLFIYYFLIPFILPNASSYVLWSLFAWWEACKNSIRQLINGSEIFIASDNWFKQITLSGFPKNQGFGEIVELIFTSKWINFVLDS